VTGKGKKRRCGREIPSLGGKKMWLYQGRMLKKGIIVAPKTKCALGVKGNSKVRKKGKVGLTEEPTKDLLGTLWERWKRKGAFGKFTGERT